MPLDSTDRFLTAPVRAVRSSRRHLHSVSYQEPVRRPPRPLRLLGALGTLGALRPLGALGPLGLLGPSKPLKPLV